MNNVPQENTNSNSPASGAPGVNTPQIDSTIVPRVRTYSGDVQHVVQTGNISQVNILVSEKKKQLAQKAQEPEASENKEKKPIGLIAGYALAIILFLAGGVGIFLFFQSSSQVNNTGVPTNNTSSTLIMAQSTKQLMVDQNDALPQIKNKISTIVNSVTEADGLFVHIAPSVIALDEQGSRADVDLTLESLFTRINTSDSGFGRLGEEYMYGVHNGKNPFLLVQVSDADEAYGRLFEWEKRMAIDLVPLFGSLEYESVITAVQAETPPVIPEATETEEVMGDNTTTEPETSDQEPTDTEVVDQEAPLEAPDTVQNTTKEEVIFAPRDAVFSDAIFYNFDARIVKDTKGTTRFMYAFIDTSLVVFATSPETLRDITNELKKRTIAR